MSWKIKYTIIIVSITFLGWLWLTDPFSPTDIIQLREAVDHKDNNGGWFWQVFGNVNTIVSLIVGSLNLYLLPKKWKQYKK